MDISDLRPESYIRWNNLSEDEIQALVSAGAIQWEDEPLNCVLRVGEVRVFPEADEETWVELECPRCERHGILRLNQQHNEFCSTILGRPLFVESSFQEVMSTLQEAQESRPCAPPLETYNPGQQWDTIAQLLDFDLFWE